MANYLCIFAAPNSHIEFLAQYPDSLWQYVEGSIPEPQIPRKLGFLNRLFGGASPASIESVIPDDWPTEEAQMIGPEINHRNVDLYHRILCDGDGMVSGAGTIFQTWLSAKNHSAIEIGANGGSFAFTSNLVPELRRLTALVDPKRVNEQYSAWLRKEGKKDTPDSGEVEELAKEFADFSSSLRAVEESGSGLVWISS